VKVEFNYIIAHSVKQYVRFQTQASRAAYPGWVTGFVYAMIGISVGGLTYGLFYLFNFALSYLNIDQPLISILFAVLVCNCLHAFDELRVSHDDGGRNGS
jgi:hypothetical protein